jgi:hypothetical protein
MDKMTIVGTDGKPKYEITPDNTIIDLRDYCTCTDPNRPEQRDGERHICLVCGLTITQNP